MNQYAGNQQAPARRRRSDLVNGLRADTQQGIFQGPVGAPQPAARQLGATPTSPSDRPGPPPQLGLESALSRRDPAWVAQAQQQARSETQAEAGGMARERFANVFAAPPTQHRTMFNMPGVVRNGASFTMDGRPRAIDTPAFPVDNRQLVTPRAPEQVAADRLKARYNMAQTYTGQHYPEGNNAAFGNRDGSTPGAPQLGRNREALIRARGANDPDYDMEGFLAKDADRLAEIQGRRDLRRTRGIERGDARHQAQLDMLRNQGQGGMNPALAMAMQRNPQLAVEMAKLQQQGQLEAKRLGLAGEGLTAQRENAKADREIERERIAQAEKEAELRFRPPPVDRIERMSLIAEEASRQMIARPSLTREQAMVEAQKVVDGQLGTGAGQAPDPAMEPQPMAGQNPQQPPAEDEFRPRQQTLTSSTADNPLRAVDPVTAMGMGQAAGSAAGMAAGMPGLSAVNPLRAEAPQAPVDPVAQSMDAQAQVERMLTEKSPYVQRFQQMGLPMDRGADGQVLNPPTARDIGELLLGMEEGKIPGNDTLKMLQEFIKAQDTVDPDYYEPGTEYRSPGLLNFGGARVPVLDHLMEEGVTRDRLMGIIRRHKESKKELRNQRMRSGGLL